MSHVMEPIRHKFNDIIGNLSAYDLLPEWRSIKGVHHYEIFKVIKILVQLQLRIGFNENYDAYQSIADTKYIMSALWTRSLIP